MSYVKESIKKIFDKMGYKLVSKSMKPYNDDSMFSGLSRLLHNGIKPKLVIDVGAAKGSWTESALNVWPDAAFLLIEPLEEQIGSLESLKGRCSNIEYRIAVAGETDGEVNLNVSDDLDGSGVYDSQTPNSRRVPVIPIDKAAESLTGPVVIKLDTHGYEQPILKGAVKTLQRTQALIIEVYAFDISPTCLKFYELTSYLDKLGFRLGDVLEVSRRPGDKLLWQADAIYYRKDHPAFQNSHYSNG